MSWWRSMVVALMTSIVGAFLSGFIAALSVEWYQISSFEGASGYFVVGMGLVGAMVGGVVGLVMSRIVAARPHPSFGRAVAYSKATMIALVIVVGGIARLQADVPPTIGGEALLLAVEVRWPKSQTTSPVTDSSHWSLRLSASSGRTVRVSKNGPMWKSDARFEGGHWIVPGAVEVFTSRGDRILDVEPSGTIKNGFIVPLPSYPGKTQLEWSEWMPHARDGDAALPDGFTYRFRVVPRNQPIRTEKVGEYEVQTIVESFSDAFDDAHNATYEANAQFAIRYRGQPVAIDWKGRLTAGQAEGDAAADTAMHFDRVNAVALVNATAPVLVVTADARYGSGLCFLLAADGQRVGSNYLAPCTNPIVATPLTSDSGIFSAVTRMHPLRGHVDRASFARQGMYLFGNVVLDSRVQTLHRFKELESERLVQRVPPLALSPDERSFVRLRFDDASDVNSHALSVTDFVSGASYVVPIANTTVVGEEYELLDPTWLDHYFEWEHRPGVPDRLVARKSVQPMVHRGLLREESDYREYRVHRATSALQNALVEYLVAELHGEALPTTSAGGNREVKIDGRTVNVSFSEDDHHVGVWMERGKDTQLVSTIAKRFDAALATRKYDALFTP